MRHLHCVVPDLFLPRSLAQQVSGDLKLPALEKMLACASTGRLPQGSLTAWLTDVFNVPDGTIAPMTALADGLTLGEDYWLRADPVHLHLNHAQVLLQTNIDLNLEEAQRLCEILNRHFASDGLLFFAPSPTRWYLRLKNQPQLTTHAIDVVEGRDSRTYLPVGADALKWHGVMNEIQMLLATHPVNRAVSERRGLMPNSVWLWGGGKAVALSQPFAEVGGMSELTHLFAQAAQIQRTEYVDFASAVANALYVDERMSAAVRRGDFLTWREVVMAFEQDILLPVLQHLRSGRLTAVTLDVLQDQGSQRFHLMRHSLWKVWQRPRPLFSYAVE